MIISAFLDLFLCNLNHFISVIAFLESCNSIGSHLFPSPLNSIFFFALQKAFHVSFVVIFFDAHFIFKTMLNRIFLRLCNFFIHFLFLIIKIFLDGIDYVLKFDIQLGVSIAKICKKFGELLILIFDLIS